MPLFITLTGQSNGDYVFTALPLKQKLPNSAGVYVVTSIVSDETGEVLHHPLLIGSCDDLSKLSDETEIQKYRNAGGNMICVKIEVVTKNRQQIEQDLKANYQL